MVINPEAKQTDSRLTVQTAKRYSRSVFFRHYGETNVVEYVADFGVSADEYLKDECI